LDRRFRRFARSVGKIPHAPPAQFCYRVAEGPDAPGPTTARERNKGKETSEIRRLGNLGRVIGTTARHPRGDLQSLRFMPVRGDRDESEYGAPRGSEPEQAYEQGGWQHDPPISDPTEEIKKKKNPTSSGERRRERAGLQAAMGICHLGPTVSVTMVT
jgi:hypothetical protein